MSAGRPSKLESRAWEKFAKEWRPGLTIPQSKDKFREAMQAALLFEQFFAESQKTAAASSAASSKNSRSGPAPSAPPAGGPTRPSPAPSPEQSAPSEPTQPPADDDGPAIGGRPFSGGLL